MCSEYTRRDSTGRQVGAARPGGRPGLVDADRRAGRGRGSDDGQGNRHQVRLDDQGRQRSGHAARRRPRRSGSALVERRDELQREYDESLTEITELQRDRLADSAGDDQADTGTKTFEREQEITLANNLLERITQVERAIDRLGEGNYGWCERCGNAIPVERLAAFPSATLCVTCKQLEERR